MISGVLDVGRKPTLFLLPTWLLLASPVGAVASEDEMVTAARRVAEAVYRESATLQRERAKLDDDLVASRYVKAAARAAQRWPKEIAGEALIVGLTIACTDARVLQRIAGEADFVAAVTKNAKRPAAAPIAAIQGRDDLWSHFLVSAYLTVRLGPVAAEAMGLAKEMADARNGTGFSFADLAADIAGIRFANAVRSGKLQVATLARRFDSADYVPSIAGLPEELTVVDLQMRRGSKTRFDVARSEIRHRMRNLPGYGQPDSSRQPDPGSHR